MAYQGIAHAFKRRVAQLKKCEFCDYYANIHSPCTKNGISVVVTVFKRLRRSNYHKAGFTVSCFSKNDTISIVPSASKVVVTFFLDITIYLKKRLNKDKQVYYINSALFKLIFECE